MRLFLTILVFLSSSNLFYRLYSQTEAPSHVKKFAQMDDEWPTPNDYRTGSGMPGHGYWQQRADHDITVKLDAVNHRIEGSETITYFNNSPDELTYLWLQVDPNHFANDADAVTAEPSSLNDDKMSFREIKGMMKRMEFDGSCHINYVRDKNGKNLPYTVVKTMMRIDLPQPLKSKDKITFSIAWNYNINDHRLLGGRCGYEYFKDDNNYIYEMAQWFPRMAVYDDVNGWQHKQYLGRGEFALVFGDYRVRIAAPKDFVIGATGELLNPNEVLTQEQRERLTKARNTYDKPVLIINQEEAKQNERSDRNTEYKTWVYDAKNVRDFAWCASRKFIWDAMGCKVGDKNVLCMSYYPKEGNPLWEQYSTQSVAHTIRVYSRYTVDYPYPVAISVNGPVGGMEYPMICFNGPRPLADGTYSEGTKIGLISVIIHEVGHNFFPMIINSDERQWTWMDEGLNSFVQYMAEQEWSRNYPSRRGPALNIIPYMKGDKSGIEPIMTNSESIIQFGNNAYGKPAAALNILRETILGRSLFDYAFKEYARRWAFKHPMPADFFRTMEDASGVDLDWFWRGWFYNIDYVDVGIKDVKWFQIDTQNPELENAIKKKERDKNPTVTNISVIRNQESVGQTLTEKDPSLKDFYDTYDPLEITSLDQEEYRQYLSKLNDEEKKWLASGYQFYQIDFENIGGLVMPIIVQFTFKDGTTDTKTIPVEIWRRNDKKVSKLFVLPKEVTSIQLDPYYETADCDDENNFYPPRTTPTRFQLYKDRWETNPNPNPNPMQIRKKLDGKK